MMNEFEEKQNSSLNKGVMFEQTIFNLLSRECQRREKKLFSYKSFYLEKTVDIDFAFLDVDGYAPDGIYDNKTTFIEFYYSKLIDNNINHFSSVIERFPRKGYQDIKLIFICCLHEYSINRIKREMNFDNLKLEVEIWGIEFINNLFERYPVEKKSFEYYFGSDHICCNEEVARSEINRNEFDLNNSELIEEFKRVCRETKISLVLGAGVSIGYNNLSWKKMVNKLYERLDEKDKFVLYKEASMKIGGDNLSISQYIKLKLDDEYASSLYSLVYPKRVPRFKRGTSLEAVGDLICKNRVKKVITYNYDDFLESCLERRLYGFNPLFRISDSLNKNFPIYHVHGFLPRRMIYDIDEYKDTIVLTEEEYFSTYSEASNWQVAIQLQTFKDDVCLFVGNSITDYNEKRLLHKTSQKFKHHYAIMFKGSLHIDDLVKIYSYFEHVMNVKILWVDSASVLISIIDSI